MTGSQAHKKAEAKLLPRGYIFNALLFLVFFLPVWDMATFKAGPVITNLREICLIMLPVVYFFYPQGKNTLSLHTKYWIILLFAVLVATEMVKKVQYGLSPFDAVKNFRITLPLLSGLLICIQGKKINPKFTLKTILAALSISYILTPLMVVLGVQPSTFSLEGRQMEVEYLRQGRFSNNNFEFSLLGIALLFYVPQIKTQFKGLKRIIIVAAILSVLILILSFNRTLLAAGAVLGLILFMTNLDFKTLKYILATLVVSGSIFGYFYFSNPAIQRQVDNRILIIFEDEQGSLSESVYYDNRDVLYQIFIDELKKHWVLGLPGGQALIETENIVSSKTDISLYNIWIRHGLLAFLISLVVFFTVYVDQRKKREWLPENSLSHNITKAVIITIPFYLLVSFNIDALVAHNAILFLLLLINFSEFEA